VNLIADTSVWSFALRRVRPDSGNVWLKAFRAHVDLTDNILLLGPIIQELLEGMRSPSEVDRLIQELAPFPFLPTERGTHIAAARIRNACQARGVQAGHVDCLIAAACVEHGFPLLTADADFVHIAKHSGLALLPPIPKI